MFPKFLRVTPLGVHPYPVRINESTVIYKIRSYDMDTKRLNVLADALGFSYEVVFAPDGDGYGELFPNGSWTGAYGMLQRGETDLVFGSAEMSEQSNEYLRVSYPHSFSEITFIARKPEHVPDTAVVLHPFSIQVWFSIIVCICLMPFLFRLLLRRQNSALNLFTSTFGSLVGQGMEQIPERLKEYLVLGSWIFGSALLYYFYAAVLLSYLTFPTLHGVRTIEDLANGIKNGKYQCTMHPFASYDRVFSNLQNPSIQEIAKNLQETKRKRTDNFIEFLESPDEGKKPAYISIRALFLPYKEFYFISEDTFYPTSQDFAMNKDFCCGSEVDKVIHRVWASGIFEKFQSDQDYALFRFYLYNYGHYVRDPPSESPLTMTELKGPFVFLVFFSLGGFPRIFD